MKKRSLIEALTIIQIMIFVGMCLFIVFESVILYQKSMKSLLAERSSMIINECHTIENRMDVVSQQTFEIFRSTIKNQENIWLPSRNENLFDIQDLSENIREKLLLYPDLDYVFAYRPDSFIVSRMQSNGEGLAKIALGEYLKQTVQERILWQGGNGSYAVWSSSPIVKSSIIIRKKISMSLHLYGRKNCFPVSGSSFGNT